VNGITFRIDESLKMKHLRVAETSNSAAIDLMSKYAITDDEKRTVMPYDEFVAIVDEMNLESFWILYTEFVACAIPKASARR
jgi:hypothetical protein